MKIRDLCMPACNFPMRLHCSEPRSFEEVENIIMKTPGVEHVSSVIGYSMLSGVNTTYSAFFLVSLKPWEERKGAGGDNTKQSKRTSTNTLSKVTSGIAFAFPPPAIPGVGTSGGVTFILQDRSGKVHRRFSGKTCRPFWPQRANVQNWRVSPPLLYSVCRK